MYQNIFVARDNDTQPIVYIWDDTQGLLTLKWSDFNYHYTTARHGNMMSIYGHHVKKAWGRPKDGGLTFEADIPPETRMLTDLYLDSDDPSEGHKVMTIDIEVIADNGLPNIESASNQIISIATHDSSTDEYRVFVLGKGKSEGLVTFYDSEYRLLASFLDYWEEVAPSIVTGWNVAGFDIPYLYRRIVKVMNYEDASRLSPIGIVKWRDSRQRYQIAGVSTLDYIELYKKFTYKQQPTYRLGAIGLYEVNMNKIEYTGTLDELYKNDLEKFIEYNLSDVKIVVEIDKKLRLIELARNICHVGHVPYEDYAYSSRFIEGTILVYLHRQGLVCPNKPIDGRELMNKKDEENEEGFEGAYVKEPTPGLYEWVYSLDLQSLYPSILMSLNISPETKSGKVINWDIEKHMKKEINIYQVSMDGEYAEMNRDKFVAFLDEMNFCISSNGILYSMEKEGVIPQIINKWFADRIEYKKLMKKYINEGDKKLADYYDKRQHVQKIFLNSIYGVLGLPIFRFYDLDNALAVTATGQDVIKTSAKFINSWYPTRNVDNCIYIDTDSIYFSSKDYYETEPADIKAATIQLAREAETALNDFYSVMSKRLFNVGDTHRFVIKGETIARTGFWLAKKRYALLKIYDLETNQDTEKLAVKGLDVVRSSYPPVFAKFMNETLMDILKLKDKQYLDSKILEFKSNLPNIDYLQVARNTSVRNVRAYDDGNKTNITSFKKGTPVHVKASIAYNRLLLKLGLNKQYPLIVNDEKVKYVYLKKNPYSLDAIAFKGFDDPPEVVDFVKTYINYEKLFETELKTKLEDFYKALGWGMISTEVNQLADNFFSF